MRLTRKVLKNRARPVTFGQPARNQHLAETMLEFMRTKKGIGLAAPQIGLSRRLFVMEVGGQIRACFNPEIVSSSPELVEMAEGCLSFPGKSCTLQRASELSVRYQNYRGDWYTERLDGLMARCFQHELDHLDGIVMQDRHKEQHAEQS
jgi:peptide deformylase